MTQTRPPEESALRSALGRATEGSKFYWIVAVLILAVLWAMTLDRIRIERADAESAAAASSRELAETYEQQIVRALGEVDQALKTVKLAFETKGDAGVLDNLKARELLPSELLFDISISNSHGEVVASTRPLSNRRADLDVIARTIHGAGDMVIDPPWRDAASGLWRIRFSRRLDSSDGAAAGVVSMVTDSAYFVSSYEASRLGQSGELALIGSDGVVLARRSGEVVSAGALVDYARTISEIERASGANRAVPSREDAVKRYSSVSKLHDFPLTVVVGLSEDEQLATVRANTRNTLLLAAGASVLTLLVLVILWRLSRQVARARERIVTEKIAHADRIEHLAFHDGLTGLPNRSLFSKLLAQSIQLSNRNSRHMAVMFLDLDRFKQLNDTLGHDAGDELLKQVAARIKCCIRESDTVARLGGDEFVVLLSELSGEDDAAAVAKKILLAVAQPFDLLGNEFRVTASIGVSRFPSDGLDEQTLTKNADIAMYQAKGQGKNRFQFYSSEMHTNSLERQSVEAGLRRALELGEFELHYHPKRDMHTRKVTGVEALLRWRHPDLGVIEPMQFIPIAEEMGLIVPIGRWVLASACAQAVEWQTKGFPPIRMAINLTERQFSDRELLTDLASTLQKSGLAASLLELEISEHLLMSNVKKNLTILQGIKSMGIRLCVDDFGAGYSSLTVLKDFPLDSVKIDQSCVRGIAPGGADNVFNEAAISIGRQLSMTIVAQGIETKEQADCCLHKACDEFQGFLMDRPTSAVLMTELLKTEMRRDELSDVRTPVTSALE